MQIERLNYFVEVARVQSINSASESLHISQQALSQSMHSLEKELGGTLFKRSNKGIQLTEKGEEVLEAALVITRCWEQLKMSLAGEQMLLGEVRLTVAPFLEMGYYLPLLAYMNKHHPQVTLKVRDAYAEEALPLLKDHTVDLALLSFLEIKGEGLKQWEEGLSFVPLRQIKLDILVSKQSPLAHLSSVRFDQLREETIVLEKTEHPERFSLVELLTHYQCHHWQMVNSFYTVQHMVADNLAVTFTMDEAPALTECQTQMVRVALDEPFWITAGVLFEEERRSEPLISAVLKGLAAVGR